MTDLAALVVRMQADNSQYVKALDQATTRLQKYSADQNKLFGQIASSVAAAFSIEEVVSFASKSIDAAADLSKFSQSTGIAVESLSALQFAAASSGVQSDALQTSLKRLNVSIAEAAANSTSKAALAFNAMGVSIKNADGSTKDAGSVIDAVADKFATYGDGANKVALATDLFGKAGENLIPLLNKGSAGIDQLKESAAGAGAVLSATAAVAAEEFTNKMLLLKTTVVDGVAVQLESRLLPTLNSLAEQMLESSKDASALDQAAEVLGTGLKLLVSSGIAVKSVFVEIGDAIGGAAAAVAAAAHGNFSQAWSILNDQSDQAAKRQAADVESISEVWKAGSADALDTIQVTAKKILQQAPPVIDLSKYLDELKQFSTSLGDEAAKLNQGTIAATQYKLQHGELAVALEKTGAAGQQFAQSALASARAIETASLSKEVADINASLQEFSGDTVTAGILKQAAATQVLTQRLTDLGGATGAAGIASVQAAQQNNTYMLEFNKLGTDAARIQTDLAAAEANTNALASSGAITSLAQLQALDEERAKAASQLAQIASEQTSIAQLAGNPALVNQAKQATTAVTALAAQTNTLENQVRGQLESAFADNFLDLETGAKSFSKAFTQMAQSIEKDLLQIVNKNIAESIFGTGGAASGAPGFLASILGGSGSSGLSGLFSKSAGSSSVAQSTDYTGLDPEMFGGGFAAGGTLDAGKWGVVGEKGPELAYAGSKDMHVLPNGAGGKNITINNSFTQQSQTGTISRRSQTQQAGTIARTLAMASARNNR